MFVFVSRPAEPGCRARYVWQWRRSRPAVMVSLNVNHATKAGRRLCIQHDVAASDQCAVTAHLNMEKRLVLRPIRDSMLTL